MLSTPGRIGVIAALPEELQSLLDAMPDAEPLQRAGRTLLQAVQEVVPQLHGADGAQASARASPSLPSIP